MILQTTAFANGEPIPREYSCDGENVSPPLRWSDIPEGVRSFALIMDDPDAPGGTFVHWVYFDIPHTVHELPRGIVPTEKPAQGGTQGSNSFGKIGYGGPCPPGGEHRYYFKLYALDSELNLKAGSSKKDLLQAMDGHIVEETQIMGTYVR
ncbi:MAG: YbhB/YbcL family Raf kinase inhibitor-like protein [Spirochaetia bacterium]